jgi:hypothetical protein
MTINMGEKLARETYALSVTMMRVKALLNPKLAYIGRFLRVLQCRGERYRHVNWPAGISGTQIPPRGLGAHHIQPGDGEPHEVQAINNVF